MTGVSRARVREKRTRGLSFCALEGASFFQIFPKAYPRERHIFAVILLSSFSLFYYARANVYGLIIKENAAKETNLEKVAVVRIGKAVCKANDMVVLF